MTKRRAIGAFACSAAFLVCASIAIQIGVDFHYIDDSMAIFKASGTSIFVIALAIMIFSGYTIMFSLLFIFLSYTGGRERFIEFARKSPLRFVLWDELLK
jgi:hypothetical protein